MLKTKVNEKVLVTVRLKIFQPAFVVLTLFVDTISYSIWAWGAFRNVSVQVKVTSQRSE